MLASDGSIVHTAHVSIEDVVACGDVLEGLIQAHRHISAPIPYVPVESPLRRVHAALIAGAQRAVTAVCIGKVEYPACWSPGYGIGVLAFKSRVQNVLLRHILTPLILLIFVFVFVHALVFVFIQRASLHGKQVVATAQLEGYQCVHIGNVAHCRQGTYLLTAFI